METSILIAIITGTSGIIGIIIGGALTLLGQHLSNRNHFKLRELEKEEKLEEILAELMEAGEVYEPKIGKFKRV
ncbi:hypothetical protein KKA03_05195 [archaeon]|nr:hypothetical protein [archaeon]